MIKLGKLTDYAVVTLVQMAREGRDGPVSAHHLAQGAGVPEPTVAKVLKILARGGLVESARGAAGGYRLARPAGDITVAEVVAVMDGPIAIVSCVGAGAGQCKAEAKCPVKGQWDPVNAAIQDALARVTIADMGGAACGGGRVFNLPRAG